MDTVRIVAFVLLIICCLVIFVIDFMKKTKEERIDTLINWAKAAVYLAEDEFGGGTGAIKLANVYKAAVELFPWLASLYSYEEFDKEIVKPALDWLNDQIAKNNNVKYLLGIEK